MPAPLPTFFQVIMDIGYARKEGRVVIPEWAWDFQGLLLSAAFWYEKSLYAKRKNILMVDSAGFTYGGKHKLHRRAEFMQLREKFYRWQCEWGDYVIGGDIPTSITKDINFINNCLKVTMENTELQFKLGAEGRFVNVIHGQHPDIISHWYNHVKGYPSIGWALGSALKTAVHGFALQLLTMYELGEFRKKTKILHCLGATSKNVAIGMHYLVDKLGIDVDIMSFDSSSSSAERFGIYITETGDSISFDDIRKGRGICTLWDGTPVVDIPITLRPEWKEKMNRTNMVNADKAWKRNVIAIVQEHGDAYEQLVDESGARFMWDTWTRLGYKGLALEIDRLGYMDRVRKIEQQDDFKLA